MKMPAGVLVLAALVSCSAGHEGLALEGAEVRIAPVGAVTAAGYFTIVNSGVADTLLALSSDAADSLTMHESMDHGDGALMMMPLTWVALPAGEQVTFAVGGKHVMLERFKRPLQPGDSLWLSLHFSSGRRIDTIVPVRAVGGEE